MSNYDSDDVFPQSPGLVPVKPRATPSPTPPPAVTHQIITIPSSAQNVSPPSSRRRKKPNRRKTRPSQSDFVLIRVMDPNRPDIAQQVGEQALNSDSGSEADDDDSDSDGGGGGGDDDEEMEERSQTTEPASDSAQTESTQHSTPPVDLHVLQETAQKALETNVHTAVLPTTTKFPPPFHRDSVVELDTQSPSTVTADTPASHTSHAEIQTSSIQLVTNGVGPKASANTSSHFVATSPNLTGERHGSFTNGRPHEDSLATSPNLRELTIPSSRGSPSQKLPALQNPHSPSRDGPAGSPNQERRLPSFRHLSELAETAINEQETSRANGYHHRQSISSIGQSPTSGARQLSISSPFPPLSASSPISANSDIQTRDPFLRSGQHLTLFSTRRPSQASDNGPYSGNLNSASTVDSYQSSDGLSPGSQVTYIESRGHRMSIDGALTSRTLPPLVGPNIQHIPPHTAGGFHCDYPNCNAPPFQTQYLLNSHANVHSQDRPHYCPVLSCPRGEGGKGFKRKNEMIRHGLVHASPGYVCPFCPDREHKYPRPDNLQRHVRVHHVDKDKDDPQLRDVLAQRPEGGSRGRRRRAS
ncbi:hypothetical protein K505DRAFT_106325 [Melanomma pulvis-pyrius CBS 109.77]|uniref:C2H2-type domain-containing protein n=1 Tax=Melanomma pulvis-pyrius CBS 109.77 TaxID=1314802 RepID=A0A6A6WWH2_9PLEO|nr:hypothetical protein K505DRAFT_106325 [Melanomma pulvis-pyrius CBS 109.77]